MGALANAAILMKDSTFQDWCMAAAAYQARQVVLEDPLLVDHQARLDLAMSLVNDPASFRMRFTVYLATDPDVALRGSTASAVGEQLVMDKVANIWTAVSKLGLT